MIKRTKYANIPNSFDWVNDWDGMAYPIATITHSNDYPTYSPLLGPDSNHLQYEPRQPIGFDLRVIK